MLAPPVFTEYWVLAVMPFLIDARADAVGDHLVDFCLRLLSRGDFVALKTSLGTIIHVYGFCHAIDGSFFEYASAYVAFQGLAEIDWMPCDTDERWVYHILDSESVHEAQHAKVATRLLDASGMVIIRRK